jgi:hypothetical protein
MDKYFYDVTANDEFYMANAGWPDDKCMFVTKDPFFKDFFYKLYPLKRDKLNDRLISPIQNFILQNINDIDIDFSYLDPRTPPDENNNIVHAIASMKKYLQQPDSST